MISLKKVAVVIDFHVKSLELNDSVDLYSIDRFQNVVTAVHQNGRLLEDGEDAHIQDFIQSLQGRYEEVFYLLQTHDTINVADFQWKEKLNRERKEGAGKVFMYPIHYIRQRKEDVVNFVLKMYEAGHGGKTILARIDRILIEPIFSVHHYINRLILNI